MLAAGLTWVRSAQELGSVPEKRFSFRYKVSFPNCKNIRDSAHRHHDICNPPNKSSRKATLWRGFANNVQT